MRFAPLIVGLCAALSAITPIWAAPDVVASIKPIHSLVSAVMEGVGEPHLIVRDGGSPHTFSMRPSDAGAIQSADLVFWVGPELENFLITPLQTLTRSEITIALIETPGLIKRAPRVGGSFEVDDHGDQDVAIDPHIWLDPENAKLLVTEIAETLAAADPGNAAIYQDNASQTVNRLDQLEAQIDIILEPVRGKPFVVFHDAYHYFEARFDMLAVGSIVVEPDIMPGARRLSAIREKVQELATVCVFSEPEFESALVDTAIENSTAKTGVLDPLGANLTNGPHLYFQLMTEMAQNMATCLTN